MINNVDNQALYPGSTGTVAEGATAKSRAIFLEKLRGLGLQYKATSSLAASVVIQDITYTAVEVGFDADPSIEISYVADGTVGSETVDVEGSSIIVHMDDTVVTGSTATQIKAAIDASEEALELITATITGTASDVQDAQSETSLEADEAKGSLYLEVSNAFSPDGANIEPTESEWTREAEALETFTGDEAVNYADQLQLEYRWARFVFVPGEDAPAATHSGRYQLKD